MLSSCGSLPAVQDAILTAYRETFGFDEETLYLPGRDRKQFERAAGYLTTRETREVLLTPGLISYFVERNRVLNTSDGEYRPSEPEEMFLKDSGAALVVPLISNDTVEGLLVCGNRSIRDSFIYEDYDLMKVLARQAAQAVANLRLSEELGETRELAAVARISSFVIHDLKNLTTSLSLVADNAQEHIDNRDFQQDAVSTMQNTIAKMKGLIQRLRSVPQKGALQAGVADIGNLSREAVKEIAHARPEMRIQCEGTPVFSRVDREEIKTVVVNLVQNAVDASHGRGTVIVETFEENGSACVRVTDSGCGMTEDFLRNHLFKPFRTTKEKGLGIGLYQCRQIVEAHGGEIVVKSEINRGTTITVLLPYADAHACVAP
jgi:putative PEP-CTERM system histidine kinase